MIAQNKNDFKVYFAKAEHLKKGQTDPKFLLYELDSEKNKVEKGRFDMLEGELEKIDMDSFEYDGKTIQKARFHLIDNTDKEKVILSMSFNNVFYNIINSIHDVNDLNTVSFSLYKKDEFPRVFVTVNNNKSSWTLEPEEMKKLKSPIKDGDEVIAYNTEKLDEKMKEMVEEINKAIITQKKSDTKDQQSTQGGEKASDTSIGKQDEPPKGKEDDSPAKDEGGHKKDGKKDEKENLGEQLDEGDDLPF